MVWKHKNLITKQGGKHGGAHKRRQWKRPHIWDLGNILVLGLSIPLWRMHISKWCFHVRQGQTHLLPLNSKHSLSNKFNTVQNSLHWEHPPIQIWQVTDTKAKGNNNKKQSFGTDKKSKCTHPSLRPWKFQSWNLGNCICFSFLVNSCSASISNRKSKWIEVIGLKYILESPGTNDSKRSNRKYKELYI